MAPELFVVIGGTTLEPITTMSSDVYSFALLVLEVTSSRSKTDALTNPAPSSPFIGDEHNVVCVGQMLDHRTATPTADLPDFTELHTSRAGASVAVAPPSSAAAGKVEEEGKRVVRRRARAGGRGARAKGGARQVQLGAEYNVRHAKFGIRRVPAEGTNTSPSSSQQSAPKPPPASKNYSASGWSSACSGITPSLLSTRLHMLSPPRGMCPRQATPPLESIAARLLEEAVDGRNVVVPRERFGGRRGVDLERAERNR
ncbi:hypothetical protein B0H13DRAFT_1854450 [Mycena leptocephala]|nr:hypothetical protein B0H13DRAFT_1854450 [Mycena leptocephala]